MHIINIRILYIVFLTTQMLCARDIKIIYTAALIDQNFEQRKNEYIYSLKILNSYGFNNPYIIEAISNGHSFFDKYSCNVIYTKINNASLRNKGVNEANSLIQAIKILNFNDDDIIIKITGRYYFTSDDFLKLVTNTFIDGYFKLDTCNQIFTGCFAIRFKYFKDFLFKLNLEMMEHNMINIEQELANYVTDITSHSDAKMMYVKKLNVTASIFGNGNPMLTYW